jgi:hypothetical protein
MAINEKPTILLTVMPYSLVDRVREDPAAAVFRVEAVDQVAKMVCSRGKDRTEAIKEPMAMKRVSVGK